MDSMFTDEDILKIVDVQYKPRVSVTAYVPQDYPLWLIAFARAVEVEVVRKLKAEE